MDGQNKLEEKSSGGYEIIFKHLESNEDDTEAIGKESEEINELRKIVLEISEPSHQYVTASTLNQEQQSNISFQY